MSVSRIVANLPSGAAEKLAVVMQYWRAGGWLMIPLSMITFMVWFRYFVMLHRMRDALASPSNCIDELERRLQRDRTDPTTVEWLARLPGAVPRLAHHVLRRMAAGLSLSEAFQQCRHGELASYSHAFYVLGAMVMAAPLLGLLGTVFGMIETFDAVAMRSGETAQMVAHGISQALITTQVGLVAALPGTFGLAHLYRLYERLRNQIDRCESHMIVLFADVNGPESAIQ